MSTRGCATLSYLYNITVDYSVSWNKPMPELFLRTKQTEVNSVNRLKTNLPDSRVGTFSLLPQIGSNSKALKIQLIEYICVVKAFLSKVTLIKSKLNVLFSNNLYIAISQTIKKKNVQWCFEEKLIM